MKAEPLPFSIAWAVIAAAVVLGITLGQFSLLLCTPNRRSAMTLWLTCFSAACANFAIWLIAFLA